MAAHAQVVPADVAAVFVGEQHLLPERVIAAALRSVQVSSPRARGEGQGEGLPVHSDKLSSNTRTAAPDTTGVSSIVEREGEAHRLGEFAGEFHQRWFAAQQAAEREQHQQRLVHCALADQTGADRLLRQAIELDFEIA